MWPIKKIKEMEFYIKLEITLMDKQTLANYCSSKAN